MGIPTGPAALGALDLAAPLLPVVEVLRPDETASAGGLTRKQALMASVANRISILRYDDLWSFCVSIQGSVVGEHTPPLRRFCHAYDDRASALEAAVAEAQGVLLRGPEPVTAYDRCLLRWLAELLPCPCCGAPCGIGGKGRACATHGPKYCRRCSCASGCGRIDRIGAPCARMRAEHLEEDEMARQAAPPAPHEDDGVDHAARGREVARTAALAAIDEQYLGEAPYDRDRVTAEIRHHLGQGVLAMLEAGRRLIVLREHEGHGGWLPLLERIGIRQQVAHRMMQAARKFTDGPNHTLVSDLQSVTKVYELAMLDDDDLEELREGGTVAGHDLDDIQRMSPTELRSALRAERAERRQRADAAARQVTRKQKEIERLNATVDSQQNEIREMQAPSIASAKRDLMLWKRSVDVISDLIGAEKRIAALNAMWREDGFDPRTRQVVKQNVGQIQETLSALSGDLEGINMDVIVLDPAATADLSWLHDDPDGGGA